MNNSGGFMNISEYLTEKTITFINEKDKYSVINTLVDKAFELGKIVDKEEFKKAIEARESLISTGIGLGIAVPHAKLAGIKDFFVIISILETPVQWDSIDYQPVSLVFLIGGPSDRQTQYLKLLSQIILVAKNEAKRKILIKAKDIDTVIKQFQG